MEQDVVVSDVTYRYPGANAAALEHVNLSIGRGEFVLITGPSGAGKTTLCETFNGMVPHSYGGEFQGKVLVKGIDTSKASVGALSFIAGMMFQDPSSQLICSTVEDEVAFGPENKGLPVAKVEELTNTYLEYVGLQEYRNRSPHALSGGQQQAVALAAVMAMEPEVYVLDEPTSNLDPVGSITVLELVGNLARDAKRTAVVVEHKLDKLVPIVDRVVVMHRGRIVYDGKPRSVMEKWAELEHMGIRPPQVSELVEQLRAKGLLPPGRIPITLEEAASDLRALLEGVPSGLIDAVARDLSEKAKKTGNSSTGDVVIEVSGLRFKYPNGVEALRGIDLEVRRGEFLAIVGQNGSGKTTLVKHFNGLLKPTSGVVRVFGLDTRRATVSDMARKVGFCFQNPDHQIFSSRVDEEIAFGPRNLGFSKQDISESVKRVAGALGLEEVLSQNPHLLGKGQKQKIAVASVLAMGPEILIVDEPTTGQDPRRSRDMMDIFKTLNQKEGKTVVVITHDMDLAAEYCDRIVVMWQGGVLLDGSPREVFCRFEELKKSRLEPPQVTRLMHALGVRGYVALNVAEALSFFEELYRRRQHG